jgi:RimJ/RimL family protein N-acetyltransferase
MKLKTERLDLMASTPAHLYAELNGRKAFQQELGVGVPENWPPDLYDRPTLEYSVNYLKQNPDAVGWAQWYMLLRDEESGKRTAAGICGLKGKPQADGTAEIGYSVLSQFQRKGLASEAVNGLLKWTFAQPSVTRVIAETYPELKPSIRVLEKTGFHLTGAGSEPGVIRFELSRAAYVKKIQEMQKQREISGR